MSFKFTCPHCNQTIECENKFEGMTAPCPRCREIVELKRNAHVPQKPQEPDLKHEHEHEQHSEPPKSAPEENRPVQSNGSNGPHKNSDKVEYKKQRFLPTLFQVCGALNLLVALIVTLYIASNNPNEVFGSLLFFSAVALASGGIFAFVLATVLNAVCDTRDYTKEMRDMMKKWLDSKEE